MERKGWPFSTVIGKVKVLVMRYEEAMVYEGLLRVHKGVGCLRTRSEIGLRLGWTLRLARLAEEAEHWCRVLAKAE